MGIQSFAELVDRAMAGATPYDYQQRLADDGLPEILRIPTGAGKTMAAVLGWLFRRRYHPDRSVRRNTPARLVFVLPQRALVEQTTKMIRTWVDRLGATDLGPHVLMGGSDLDDQHWKWRPEQDAIVVGTQDMVLSRLLMRGYAEPRAGWPVGFGLLHSGSQFVFDEVQLMGPGLPTSLQLHGLRTSIGTAIGCRSTWMSATLDPARLADDAPDFTGSASIVELSAADRAGPLGARLNAVRTVHRIEVDDRRHTRSLTDRVLAEHTPGTRTLIVVNTVDRAAELYDSLAARRTEAGLVLLHSRFRPADRRRHTEAVIADPPPAGTIVVSTQVLEAGIDVTSELLVTEVAPWSSIVQRAGRCNRDGRASRARILWTPPPPGRGSALPYEDTALAHARGLLETLEGQQVTTTRLHQIADDIERPIPAVLRRRDLVDLFDTAPDLDGNDIDVGPWIRDGDERTVSVAWRDVTALRANAPFPGRDELCPAPAHAVRELVAAGRPVRIQDQRRGDWRVAGRDDVRAGGVVVLDAAQGGYTLERGFAPRSTAAVTPVPAPETRPVDALATDPLSLVDGSWITLRQHLADVEQDVTELLDALDPDGLTSGQRHAATLAARWHDLGKAHPTFEASLRRASPSPPNGDGPWAKSHGRGRLDHRPPYFRHELVSALVLLDPAVDLLSETEEPELAAYLVHAHHGKVRLSVRGRPDEQEQHVLGVRENDTTMSATLPDGSVVPPVTLSLTPTKLGRDGLPARAIRLRDRPDVGVFRLAFLEAVVRVCDQRISAGYEEPTP